MLEVAPQAAPNPVFPGAVVICSSGSWAFLYGGTLSYQWYLNGSPISGATSSNYTTSLAELGDTLFCAVTATNTAGSAGPVNSNTVAVAYANPVWDVFIWDEYVWA